MGFFGRFVYSAGGWHEKAIEDVYLSIDIHDSDIATVEFRPAHGLGLLYLGFQPRDYFEDPQASPDVDVDAEVDDLVAWAHQVSGVAVPADELRSLVADQGVDEPIDDFVEQTVQRLIRLLGLPVPDELAAVG